MESLTRRRRGRRAAALLVALSTSRSDAAFVPSSLATIRRNQRAPFLARRRHQPSLVMVSSSPPSDAPMNTIPPTTRPLSPLTFAGQVEQALISKFGTEPIAKVLDSWRWADMEYEHRQFVGPLQDPPITDPEGSHCHQLAPSYVPGLTCRQFWDESKFDWARKLAESYPVIKEEFSRVTGNMDDLQKRGNNIWAGALTEDAAGYGLGWKTLVLVNRGIWDPVNAKLFPQTARAVHESGVPAAEVFFASMQPGSDIKIHSDFTNFVLTSHLALDIPDNGENKCRLSIGDETRQWLEGEVMVFDTSILHSAVNESDRVRYILMFRIWHPDLTDVEREALQFVYDCLEMPDLLSHDPGTRFMAEQRVAMARTFPELGSEKDDDKKDAKAGFAVEGRGGKGKKKKKDKKRGGGGGGGKGFGS